MRFMRLKRAVQYKAEETLVPSGYMVQGLPQAIKLGFYRNDDLEVILCPLPITTVCTTPIEPSGDK